MHMTLTSTKPPRNWDPVVKLTHWSIVVAVLANGVFTEGGSWPHIWVGYALAGMLALRLLWGIVGPHEARFRLFHQAYLGQWPIFARSSLDTSTINPHTIRWER
jgi:cytochrome b